jgi:hypothetical protein
MGKSVITFETYGDAGAVTELVGREAIAVLRKGHERQHGEGRASPRAG